MRDGWTDIMLASFREVLNHLAAVAPRLLAALALVVLGLTVAALARHLTVRTLRATAVDTHCTRWGVTAALARTGLRQPPSELVGRLVFWVLLVIALLMSVEALEVPATAGLAAMAIRVLPNLVIVLLVLMVGWLIAQFLAQAVLIFLVNAQVRGGAFAAGVVRWLVLLFAGSVALTQLNIGREMVLLVFGIAFGGAVLTLALAFGLGARELAREALESWLRERRPGELDSLPHV